MCAIPLRLSHHNRQFSASIFILSEVLRYAQIIRERPGLWWNLQDSNLRSLPLSVKRRIPPRPRFRMPPSFRGVSSLAFGAKHVVVWLVTVFLYGLPSGVVPDFSPYIPGWLPHGGRDPLPRHMYPGKRRG